MPLACMGAAAVLCCRGTLLCGSLLVLGHNIMLPRTATWHQQNGNAGRNIEAAAVGPAHAFTHRCTECPAGRGASDQ